LLFIFYEKISQYLIVLLILYWNIKFSQLKSIILLNKNKEIIIHKLNLIDNIILLNIKIILNFNFFDKNLKKIYLSFQKLLFFEELKKKKNDFKIN
jgi:hypothetical protein